MEAVKDRCIYNELSLNSEQIKEKILSKFEYKPNMKIWDNIKNNLFVENEKTNLIKKKVYEIIKYSTPQSVRDDEKLILIGKLSMRLVNDLSLLNLFVEVDDIKYILEMDMPNKEKVKEIAKIKKCSIRNAQKIVKSNQRF